MKIKLIDFGLKNSGVEVPSSKHYNDAGCDIRITNPITLSKGQITKIPLKFGVEIPDGYMGLIFPRSGLNSKGITMLYSPIDSGYRGEVCALLYNTTGKDYMLFKGDRIGQLVVVPYMQADYVWDFEEEKREDGGFGSTGIK